MYGAILGDIIGSPYEFDLGDKTKNFPLFSEESYFTDDTVMTIAVAEAFMDAPDDENTIRQRLIHSMQRWGHRYPGAGYGVRFCGWLESNDPQPYNSWGNGSAMRVSALGWLCGSIEEVWEAAARSAMPTHNHPEGVKGAVATASAIFLARTVGKDTMLKQMRVFYPRWQESRIGANRFDETCQGTMPVVFGIIQKANSFEEAIRCAMAVGGDSDTIGAIVGSIAEAIWGVSEQMRRRAMDYLPSDMVAVVEQFYERVKR